MRILPSLARAALAGAGGVAVFASFAPTGWWWAAPLGVAAFFVALTSWRGNPPTIPVCLLVGFAFGLGDYLCLLPWVGEFVGPVPYLGLAGVLAAYPAVGAIAVGLALRYRLGLMAAPFIMGLIEWCQSSFPFGGFAWVRLAWGQVDGPFAALVRFGGPALVSLAVSAVAAGLTAIFASVTARADGPRGRGNPVLRPTAAVSGACCVAIVLALGMGAGMTVDPVTTQVGSARVAAIQGNVPRMGLDFAAQRRAVLDNHVRETMALAAEQKGDDGGAPGIDLVFWPENASDVDAVKDDYAADRIRAAAAAVGAPILVGTVTHDEVGARNMMVAIDQEGRPGDFHYKKFLQPFGETMPWRDFFAQFTDLASLAGDMKPGEGDGTVGLGGVTVGVATCYEVIFDQAFRDAVRSGAQLLTTPTNNATFGFTDMTYQQLAMSRMRAIEFDRAVVVPATSGASAIVSPSGEILQRTRIFDPAHLVADLPLKSGRTPSVYLSAVVAPGVAMIGAVCGLMALIRYLRSSSDRGTAKR